MSVKTRYRCLDTLLPIHRTRVLNLGIGKSEIKVVGGETREEVSMVYKSVLAHACDFFLFIYNFISKSGPN